MCGTCSFSRFGCNLFQVSCLGGYEVGKQTEGMASADEVSGLWFGMPAAFCLV